MPAIVSVLTRPGGGGVPGLDNTTCSRVYVGIVRQLVLWDIHINEDGSFCFGGHCIIPN